MLKKTQNGPKTIEKEKEKNHQKFNGKSQRQTKVLPKCQDMQMSSKILLD